MSVLRSSVTHETSFGFWRDWVRALRTYHYARTTTSIRRHANQENNKQDPRPRKQMNLFMLGVDLACSFVSARVCVLSVYASVLMHGLQCRPACAATFQ